MIKNQIETWLQDFEPYTRLKSIEDIDATISRYVDETQGIDAQAVKLLLSRQDIVGIITWVHEACECTSLSRNSHLDAIVVEYGLYTYLSRKVLGVELKIEADKS